LNIAFFELFAFFLFFATKRLRLALRMEAVISLLIGLINYFVIQFRSNPVMPWDIFSIRTAASVANNYQYKLEPRALICILVFTAILAVCQLASKKADVDNKKQPTFILTKKVRITGALICALCLFLLGNYVQTQDCVKRFHIYDKLFTPNTMTYKDGTVVAFLLECQYLSVKEPASYSNEKAEKLLAQAAAQNENGNTGQAQKELPNIIVIMNEAFSDLSILDAYVTNEDEMPYMRSLMNGAENTISGYMDVSVLGGNTANTEFEFLTGNTMAFLPQGCIPYQQYVHDSMPSMASSLKEMGYRTLALHPYGAKGWDRHEVYEYFGFDAFYSKSDFTDPHILRKYISDQADVEKVIELYEQDPDIPLFLFNVTMQNHSSYSDAFDNFTPTISVEGSDSFALNQYLSLLRESDRSLKQLITYFEQVDDPTIIVFFGDHQPTDSVVAPIYKLNNRSVYSLTEEELCLRYQVPYIIHANFDIEESQNVPMSTNYLGIKTLEAAGLPLNNYQQFLSTQYEIYPSISMMQITDSDGNRTSISDKETLLESYEILQYYHLFEK
jgi:phosphoglycerol transferase MdoB-like AlkP superfamily enzyme